MQQAGVCCRPAGAGRSSGGTRTGRRHRFSSRFEAISRALQPGSEHAQPGVRTSTCTCTYNRWVWGGIKKKICRIRPLLLCGCVVHLLNYHWAGYEENLIVEKKNRPPPPCGARCVPGVAVIVRCGAGKIRAVDAGAPLRELVGGRRKGRE